MACRGDIDVQIGFARKTFPPNNLEISRKNHAVGRIDEVLLEGT